MSNIVAGSQVTSALSINYAGAVTPDSLLLYCSMRIRSIDDQVQTQFKKQEQYRSVTQAVNGLNQEFSAQANAPPGEDGQVGNPQWCDRTVGSLNEAIKAAPPNSAVQASLIEKRDRFINTSRAQCGHITKDEAKLYAEEFSALAKELGSSAELDMINLNSLMSQRQSAIQMITNMLASLGETQKAIAAKIG